MAPECEIDYIGIRPGEKLHESMISEDEARQTIELEDRYVIQPAHSWWATREVNFTPVVDETDVRYTQRKGAKDMAVERVGYFADGVRLTPTA